MEKITSILREYTVSCGNSATDKLLGAAAIILNKNGILYSGAAGKSSFGTNATAWTLDSSSWIASLTKLITSSSVMQLVDQGRLSLDQDMRDVVPELETAKILRGFDASDQPIIEKNTRPITLKSLLTHTLGVAYDITDPDLIKYSEIVNRTDNSLSWTKEGFLPPLKFPPGDGWVYGPSMDWAGQVLEHTVGVTLGEYMQEHIFTPLGMTSTGFWPGVPLDALERQVDWSYRQEDGSLIPGPSTLPSEPEMQSGGAGLFSTARDYAAFLQAFLDGDVVSEHSMELMFTPQLNERQIEDLMAAAVVDPYGITAEFPLNTQLTWGLAGIMNIEDIPGKRAANSTSWSGVAGSRWWIDRNTGVAGIVFVNVQPFGDPVVKELYDEVERAVYAAL